MSACRRVGKQAGNGLRLVKQFGPTDRQATTGPSWARSGDHTQAGTVSRPLAVYTGINPVLSVNFARITPTRPEVRAAFLDAISDFGGHIDISQIRAARLGKRPGLPLRSLLDPQLYHRLIDAMRLLETCSG